MSDHKHTHANGQAQAAAPSPNRKVREALEEIGRRPQLQQKYNQVLRLLNRNSSGGVRTMIDLGTIGAEIRNSPNRVYGDGAVDLLARALNWGRATFRRALQAVSTYTEEELQQFLERFSEQGMQITPAHLYVVMVLPSREQRHRLIELFYRKSVGYRELAKKAGELGNRGDKNPPKVQTLASGIARIRSLTNSFSRQLKEDLDPALFAPLRQIGVGRIGSAGPEELAEISSVREQLENFLDLLSETVDTVRKAETRLETKLGAPA